MSKAELERENKVLHTENVLLKEELSQLRKLIFSSKRERYTPVNDPGQTVLFDGEEPAVAEAQTVEDVVVRKGKKKSNKKVGKRNSFPTALRREETIIWPAGETEGLIQIGQDITELLAYVPASLCVKRIVRPRMANRTAEDAGIFQAPIPPRIVPKGMVDESLIAQIIVEKIQFHTPIYRFAKKLKQAGVDFIKENNLHNWFHAGAESLKPLYHLLVEDILSQGYVQGDETRIPVLAKNKIGAAHRGQMWAFFAPTIRAAAFNYEPTRSTQSAKVILDQFKGTLQTDGYVAYEKIGERKDIQLIYCMAHARRKFFDAKDSAPDLANYFLEKLQGLYELERQARDKSLSDHQRFELRQQKAIPILKELESWLTIQYADRTLVPKSLIRKAINYTFKRWKGLCTYAHDGKLEIDNNLVENTIRPIALGRKNYMFAGSHDAAQNLAVLYSLIGTCEKNGINAFDYIHWALQKVAANKVTPEAVEWLPHRIDPEVLRK